MNEAIQTIEGVAESKIMTDKKTDTDKEETFFLWFPFALSLGALILVPMVIGALWLTDKYSHYIDIIVNLVWK